MRSPSGIMAFSKMTFSSSFTVVMLCFTFFIVTIIVVMLSVIVQSVPASPTLDKFYF
jgi:hypothetical protein